MARSKAQSMIWICQVRQLSKSGRAPALSHLLFARAGAEHVYTCEMNPKLARVARETVDSTAYGDKITVIDRTSSEALQLGLLPSRPDVIFTETLDCGVVGEAYFEIAKDVRMLADRHTIVLPQEVRQIGVLIESPQIVDLNAVHDVCGFDLSRLNQFSTRNYFPVREELYDYRCLTSPEILRCYDYLTETAAPVNEITATADGRADGVMTWLEIQFGDHVFANPPGISSHWHKAFHPFRESINVEAGEHVNVCIDDNGVAISDVISSGALRDRLAARSA